MHFGSADTACEVVVTAFLKEFLRIVSLEVVLQFLYKSYIFLKMF